MRFFQTLLTGAALVGAAFSLTFDSWPSTVEAGKTYTIAYSPKDNTPTTIILRKGVSTNLDTLDTLTTTATGGSFSWTVNSKYVDGSDYALEIRQASAGPNYSGQFALTGGEGTISSAVSSVRSASSTAASSAQSTRSASATVSPSAGLNSTVSAPTLSVSRTSGTSRPTGSSSGSPPESTGAASSLATSPFVALFGAFAAFAYLA